MRIAWFSASEHLRSSGPPCPPLPPEPIIRHDTLIAAIHSFQSKISNRKSKIPRATMSLQDEYSRWEKSILDPSLKRFPERKPRFETSSGIEVPRLPLPDDADPDYMDR